MDTILDLQWHTLSKRPVADVRDEVAQALIRWHGSKSAATAMNNAGDLERVIHIGTDAQKHGKKTDFATVVCVMNPGHGGIAFYAKNKLDHIASLQHKLFTEVGYSLELALALCEYGINAEAIDVHVDANTNMRWESAPFHQRLAGMVMAHGFKAVLKPDSWVASHVADHAVKHKNESKQTRRKLRKKGKKVKK